MPVRIADSLAGSNKTSIGGRFRRFQPEEEKSSRKAVIKEGAAIERLKNVWSVIPFSCVEGYYEVVSASFRSLDYSAEDVERFSLAVAEFKDEKDFSFKAGTFLSALINNGKERDYIVHIPYVKIQQFGYLNRKNITVKGDVGDLLGTDMEGGKIIVKGNAGSSVGMYMKGGSIVVEGNAGDCVGLKMKSGEITVKREVVSFVGQEMEGGTLTIEGNAGYNVGRKMLGGIITVRGNVSNALGCEMRAGKIIIEGNAGILVGVNMKGGEITVKGNAGNHLGQKMQYGVVHVEGEIEHISSFIKGGRVYLKEKLIFEK
jgi:formylmethanofuran dehydrogenase subunit C